MKNSHLPILGVAFACCVSAHAALVVHFRLEEGAIDSLTNVTHSAIGGYSATFEGGVYLPAWATADLATVPVSEGGTVAAVSFDSTDTGTDPYLSTDYEGVLGSAARTFAAWIKAAPNQPNFATFLAYGNNGTGQAIRFRLDPSGYLRLEYSGSAALGTIRRLNDGQWHHVAATLPNNATAGSTVFYIDGNVEPTSISQPNNVLNTTAGNMHPMTLGNSRHSLGTYGFNGLVDDVRIYDTQLTQAEVQALVFGAGNPPSIEKQPVAQKALLGGTNELVSFSVDVSGSPPLTYHWKRNNADVPGGTAQNLVIGPVTVADLGSYSVAVSNSYGYAISAAVDLSWGTPSVDPSEQTVVVGGEARFSILMPADSSGYTYQWKKGGVTLDGGTADTYTISSAAIGDAGDYTVEVSLSGQMAVSDAAQLRVVAAPASAYARLVLEDGAAGYWRLGEATGAPTAADVTGFHPGSYLGGGDLLGQAGALTGDSDTAAGASLPFYVEVPYAAALNRTSSFTIEGWAKPTSATGRQSIIASRTSTRSSGYELLANGAQWQFRTGASDNATVETWNNLNGGTVAVDQWHHVVGTYDGGTKRLYVNGVLVGTQDTPVFRTLGTPLRIGANQTYNAGAGDFFNGILDEVAVYWRTLTDSQVSDHYQAGLLGMGVAPSLTVQPASQRIVLGDTNATATFTVAATGSPRLAYQWSKEGSPLPGATGASLTFNPASSGDLGTYSVTVINASGTASSTNVTLSHTTGPVTPGPLALLTGAAGSFTVNMPVGPAYTYQWKRNGVDVPGATSATLLFPSAASGDAGTYTVLVQLGLESAESDPVTLVVLPVPAVSYATAVGADVPVAWWRLGDAAGSFVASDSVGANIGSAFGDVFFGQEGALLGDTDTAARFTGYSAGGRAGLSKIDVGYNPTLNGAIFSVECWALVEGGSGTFRSPVTSRATTPQRGYLIYAGTDDRWQFWIGDGVGAWNAVTGPAVVENEWTHLVGTYDGVNMAFYVNGALVGSGPSPFAPNDLYGLRVGAGQTENTVGSFFFPGLVDEVAVYGTALSAARVQAHYAAAFQLGTTPRLTLQPLSRATLEGETYSLSARAHSGPGLTYQWRHAGTNLPSQTTATLSLPSVSTADAGSYDVVAGNGAGSTPSATADLSVLPGQAVSVNLQGFENVRTIAANGGVAGVVAVGNWNEVAYNANSGSVTGLVNHKAQPYPMTVTWRAQNNRRWNGPYRAPAADYALLNGVVDGVTSNAVVTISEIPASFQSAGYSLYVYLGAPHAGSGIVTPSDWFAAVSVGTVTNYYHAMDLALWDGHWLPATTTDPAVYPPTDANYALFTGLTSSTAEIIVDQHPFIMVGPPFISGFQIVANVSPAIPPVPLTIGRLGADVVLSWEGNWVLQRRNALDDTPNAWQDVDGAASPYPVPQPLSTEQYYRLRSP